jgi:hypothetical protein
MRKNQRNQSICHPRRLVSVFSFTSLSSARKLILSEESDYEPEFELPDFAELGKGLRNLSCFDYEEYNPEDFVDDRAILKASGWTENEDDWERLPLEEIGELQSPGYRDFTYVFSRF